MGTLRCVGCYTGVYHECAPRRMYTEEEMLTMERQWSEEIKKLRDRIRELEDQLRDDPAERFERVYAVTVGTINKLISLGYTSEADYFTERLNDAVKLA